MRTTIPLLTAALAGSLASAPAHARARVFVASYGNDANPCTFGSPCKTFQQAVNVVDACGEVTAIDSAGFGPISISKSVTITSPDGVEAGIVAVLGGDAIAITAGISDKVLLRGLTIDGANAAHLGIDWVSGASLNVQNCLIRNFTQEGILFHPSESGALTVANTVIADNAGNGVQIVPSGLESVRAVFDHVQLENNKNDGAVMNGNLSTGGFNELTITNSVIAHNIGNGIFATGTHQFSAQVMVQNSTIADNSTGLIQTAPASSQSARRLSRVTTSG